ncbi:MAG: GtrA family protein [Bacteroidaceae bacterium]|nr:GtrA family protein [Bacteroidaceae bacterium]
MNCKTITTLTERLWRDERFMQFVRFCIIGTFSAAVHYGIYFLLQRWIPLNMAYTAGYVLSFVGNFFLTSYFTFRRRPSWRRFFGFAGSHGLNYCLHIVLFNFFLWLGVHRLVAPPLVMLVAMLVQFTVLRWVFKK